VSAADPVPLPEGVVAVVTMDRRASRAGPDDVAAVLRRLNERHGALLARRFVRTAGDEIQGVAHAAGWLVDLVLADAAPSAWWIGVGIGAYEAPLGRTARESRGPAFYDARRAVTDAKRAPWGFALLGRPGLERAEAALAVCAWILRHRTPAQREAAELLAVLGTRRAVAGRLGVSAQAVSQRLRTAGLDEEARGRRLAAELLRDAVGGDG
jgi:hypothetical protein